MNSTRKLAALLLVTHSACGSARLGSTTKFGGSVVLDGHYMPALMEARTLMSEHCGSPYQVTERDQVVDFRCGAPTEQDTALAANAQSSGSL